jgi:hypothetical protein
LLVQYLRLLSNLGSNYLNLTVSINYNTDFASQVYRPKSLEFRNIKLMCYELWFYMMWLITVIFFISQSIGDAVSTIEAERSAIDYWSGCRLNECEIDKARDTGKEDY